MHWPKVFIKPVELAWAGAARSDARPMGRKPDGEIGSGQFLNKPTEYLLSVQGCVRQFTVLPRKIRKADQGLPPELPEPLQGKLPLSRICRKSSIAVRKCLTSGAYEMEMFNERRGVIVGMQQLRTSRATSDTLERPNLFRIGPLHLRCRSHNRFS